MVTALQGGTPEQRQEIGSLVSGYAVASGAIVKVRAFSLAGFDFAGGQISIPADGTWFVGVEVWSKQLRALHRVGHTGWIPVASVVMTGGSVTSVKSIDPCMPETHCPRTMKKVLAGSPVSVVIMGPSLCVSSGAATDWPGMIFGSGDTAKYRIPGTISVAYTAVAGSPSAYQLAQIGFASSHTNYGYTNAGFTGAVTSKSPPNGRSKLFDGVDLVVISCLANGTEYVRETIEPLVRQLRKRGVEVILCTDNPFGPSTSLVSMVTAGLVDEGLECIRVASLYKVDLADTAAYVISSYIAAGGTGIYVDSIHQTTGVPAGPSAAAVSCGHEAWARAVRSCIPVAVGQTPTITTTRVYPFASSMTDWASWGGAAQSIATGSLVTTIASVGQGMTVTQAGAVQVGDTVTLTYDSSVSGVTGGQIGMQGASGWNSNIVAPVLAGTQVTATLTVTAAHTAATVLFYAGSGTGTWTLDNVTMSVTRAPTIAVTESVPGNSVANAALPSIRIVTDYGTPADAFVILPKDELYLTAGNPNKGSLGAHPWGANSFARRFSASVGASEDLLVLAPGKRAVFSGDVVTALRLIHYREPADGTCTVDVYVNNSLNKTLTVAAAPFANEWVLDVFNHAQTGANSPTGGALMSCELRVTSGSLKVAAFFCETGDLTYLVPEQITYVGPGWLAKETSKSGIPGRPTDTAGDYAVAYCTGQRLAWVLSSNPGSKLVTYRSARVEAVNQTTVGNSHAILGGALLSPDSVHAVICSETNASGSQANGHALHVGGAIVINDR